MRLLIVSTLLVVAGAGCHLSPIPKRINEWHSQAVREVPILERLVQAGDIVFRLSNTELAGGLVDFSRTVAKSTNSQLSHAALIYHVGPDGAIILDVTPAGLTRRYLVDWYIDGTRNLVVRRLKPEYQFLIPQVLAEADRLIARDVLYDDKFDADNDRYYCTELVDHCFRITGHPLAPMIRIKDFPRYDLVVNTACLVGGIDTRNLVAVAGNERIGLYSSPMLETVVDFRGRSPAEIERLLPRTQLVNTQDPRNEVRPEVLPAGSGPGRYTPYFAPSFSEPDDGPEPAGAAKTSG